VGRFTWAFGQEKRPTPENWGLAFRPPIRLVWLGKFPN
jgi:hypothetical protein